MKTKYIIVGSDNFWYACCSSIKEVREEIDVIKSGALFGNPETKVIQEDLPEKLHIYKAEKIETIKIIK